MNESERLEKINNFIWEYGKRCWANCEDDGEQPDSFPVATDILALYDVEEIRKQIEEACDIAREGEVARSVEKVKEAKEQEMERMKQFLQDAGYGDGNGLTSFDLDVKYGLDSIRGNTLLEDFIQALKGDQDV